MCIILGGSNASSQNNNIQLKEASHSTEPTSLDSIHSMTSTIILGTMPGASSLTSNGSSSNERTRDLALCAVILDEWLKELSAIAQEQSIVMLSDTLEH